MTLIRKFASLVSVPEPRLRPLSLPPFRRWDEAFALDAAAQEHIAGVCDAVAAYEEDAVRDLFSQARGRAEMNKSVVTCSTEKCKSKHAGET
jgi:hypothetical protein